MRKIVIASDSFKGTISSREIADIYENIAKEKGLDLSIVKVPLADGGENTLEVFSSHFVNGEYHYLEVTGPNFNKVNAKYFTYDDVAVIELAQAAGLPLMCVSRPRNMGEKSMSCFCTPAACSACRKSRP